MENNRSTAEKLGFLTTILGNKIVGSVMGIGVRQVWIYKKGKSVPKKLTIEKIDYLYAETNDFLSKIGAEGYGQK